MSSYIYLLQLIFIYCQHVPNVFPVFMSLFCYDSSPPRHPVTIIEALFFSSSSSALNYLYCQGRDSVGLAKLDFYFLLSKLFFLSLSSIRSAFVQLCCQRAVQTSKFQCPCMIYVLFMTAIRCSYPLYPSTDQLILNSRRRNLN